MLRGSSIMDQLGGEVLEGAVVRIPGCGESKSDWGAEETGVPTTGSESRWAAVVGLAKKQTGLITREQARSVGFPDDEWDYRVRRNAILQLERGVYEVTPPEDADLRRYRVGLLLVGDDAVLSHRSAARLHGLWGIDGWPIELTTPRRIVRSVPMRVYRGEVAAEERSVVQRLPVTGLIRTVTDLVPHLDPVSLAGLIESARHKQRNFTELLQSRVEELDLPLGLPNLLQWVIDDAKARPRPMDSMFEIQFWHRWLYTGLPMPVPQFEVRYPQGGRSFIDFAWPQFKVAVETQGYAIRDTPDSFDHDSERTARLTALGWVVIPVSYKVFRNSFIQVMNAVREAVLARRRAAAAG